MCYRNVGNGLNILIYLKKRRLNMVHTDFQEVIKQLSTDEEFRKDLASDSEEIKRKYGMMENGLLAIKTIDPIGIKKEELRPVAWCCTCLAPDQN
jgi:formylmethanofuran dehydrogenase subunit E